jgi:hypothetical protein
LTWQQQQQQQATTTTMEPTEFVSIEDRFGTSAPKAMSKVMYHK